MKQILDADGTCHDQQVMNDTELYLLIHKPGTKDEFEPLEEVSGQEFEYEYPQKKKEEKKKEEDADEWPIFIYL